MHAIRFTGLTLSRVLRGRAGFGFEARELIPAWRGLRVRYAKRKRRGRCNAPTVPARRSTSPSCRCVASEIVVSPDFVLHSPYGNSTGKLDRQVYGFAEIR